MIYLTTHPVNGQTRYYIVVLEPGMTNVSQGRQFYLGSTPNVQPISIQHKLNGIWETLRRYLPRYGNNWEAIDFIIG